MDTVPQGQSRVVSQSGRAAVQQASRGAAFHVGTIDARKLPSLLGRAATGKPAAPVRVDEGHGVGDGSGNDNQSSANSGVSITPQNGTGKVIQDANIHLMFWGNAWASASSQPTAVAVATALNMLISGPYSRQAGAIRREACADRRCQCG